MDIELWVGNMDEPPDRREAYRGARIEISGLLFLVMEPPDPKYPFEDANLRIDGCDMNLKSELLQTIPADAFFRSLWVSDWNAFIHIAARNAQISFASGAIDYRKN